MANYKYNGVTLPDVNKCYVTNDDGTLTEWTGQDDYPYTAILADISNPGYREGFMTNPQLVRLKKPWNFYYETPSEAIEYTFCILTTKEEVASFGISDAPSYFWWVFGPGSASSTNDFPLQLMAPFWANYDCSYIWGNVKSDPVKTNNPYPTPLELVSFLYVALNGAKNKGYITDYSHIAVAENKNYISVHFLTDDFELVTYDADTTIYTAKGIGFYTWSKKDKKSAFVDNTTTTSEGSRYISHWVWSEVDVTWNGATIFTNQEGWYYNSVKLPELPELDKSVYPYAYIFGGDASIFVEEYVGCVYFELMCHDVPLVNYDSIRNPSGVNYISYAYATGKAATDSGLSGTQFDYSNFGFANTGDLEAETEFVQWSSCDILNEDGSVFLSASEPVHVTYVIDEDDDEGGSSGGGGSGDDDDDDDEGGNTGGGTGSDPDDPDTPTGPAYTAYIGDENGIARKIIAIYVGDENGIARKVQNFGIKT